MLGGHIGLSCYTAASLSRAMKPPPFDYLAPDTLEGALNALSRHGGDAKVLAGGQSLIPLLNFRLASPSLLIDLGRIPDLSRITPLPDGGLALGAMTRHSRLEREDLVKERAPLLAEAAPWIAHPQVRNRGTVGGSLAHADPAAELPALALALKARLRLLSLRGERWIEAKDFFTGLLSTALEPDELLVEISVPPLPARTGTAFLEVARRHGDYAQCGVAALVTLEPDGRCREARWVYLSVGDTPRAAGRAAASLTGNTFSESHLAEAAAQAASEDIDPSGDIHASAAFKRHLARVIAGRALTTAWQRASERLETPR